MKLNMTITQEVFSPRETRAGYRAMTAKLDNEEHVLSRNNNPQLALFTDMAVGNCVNKGVRAGEFVNITVTTKGYTLSDDVKQTIVDRYSSDEFVTSITFA